jgi:hypothetical protein
MPCPEKMRLFENYRVAGRKYANTVEQLRDSAGRLEYGMKISQRALNQCQSAALELNEHVLEHKC